MLYKGENAALRRYSLIMILFGASLFGFPVFVELFPAQFRWFNPEVNMADERMILSMYFAIGICFIMGAKDPVRNAIIVDYTIISSFLHASVMLYYALVLEGEMPHLWGDVPFLYGLAIGFLIYHPKRVARRSA
jgi:hypothetical protein